MRDALAAAAREGWAELVPCDAAFDDWPLGERAVGDVLQAWSRTGRRLTLLAREYDTVVRRHALFVRWRQTWDHIVECRDCRSADPLDLPSAIWSPGWVLQRLDPVRSVGVTGAEPTRRLQLRARIDEWLRRSSPAFPASVSGL
ncbi:MAG: hypothetical protein GAK38_00882 [Xylophilus sp.]|nr:MAG: hypothetical protein GAK38_00882 [Xylophilus sp.]